jgi:hypothetical protein
MSLKAAKHTKHSLTLTAVLVELTPALSLNTFSIDILMPTSTEQGPPVDSPFSSEVTQDKEAQGGSKRKRLPSPKLEEGVWARRGAG